MSQAGEIPTPKLPKMAAGQRYGLLVSVALVERRPKSKFKWLFRCDCGGQKIAWTECVRSGATRSCGCLPKSHSKGGRPAIPALEEARLTGATQYNTGQPCARGHYANKWTCNGTCVECERESPNSRNRLARTYGLADWNAVTAIKKTQNNCCAICKEPFLSTKHTHIDHCHREGQVRGILCRNCNHGLGYFLDNSDHLRAAAAYVDAFNSGSRPVLAAFG